MCPYNFNLSGLKKQILAIIVPFSSYSNHWSLFESLEYNKMLHQSQFAYRKKNSTEHAVLTMTEKWQKTLTKDLIYNSCFIHRSIQIL